MNKVLRFENTAKVQLSLADEYMKKGNVPSAINAMRASYKISGDTSSCVTMGEFYLQVGLVDMAFEAFAEAYTKGNKSIQCLFGLCRTAFFMGYDKESGEYFKKIFLQNTEELQKMNYEVDEMGEEFEEVTGGVKNRGFSFVNSSEEKHFDEDLLSLVKNNPEKALPYFENVPKSSKLFYEARNNIALIKLMLGSFEESLAECNYVLSHKPNDVFALSTMLAAYASLNQKEKAQNIANKIDSLAVTDEEDIRKIALAMCQAELHDFAVKYLDKLHFQKYDRNVMLLRAIAYYNSGNKKGGLSILKDMKKLYPKDSIMLSDTEFKMKVGQVVLPYSVIMLHGETLFHIGESRALFGAEKEEKDFDFDTFINKLKDEKNYRLLYWYLTNHAYFCKDDEIIILFRLCQTKDKNCIALLTEILRDINVDDHLKSKCIRVLICNGHDEVLHLVQGVNIKSSLPIYPEDYMVITDKSRMGLLWANAYAIAYSELFMREEGFEQKLCEYAENVWKKLEFLPDNYLCTPFALAAIMYKNVVQNVMLSNKELSNVFGVNLKTLKKYENICNGEENDENN